MYLAEIRPNFATHVAVASCVGLASGAVLLVFGEFFVTPRAWLAWGAIAASLPVSWWLLRDSARVEDHEAVPPPSTFMTARLVLMLSMFLGFGATIASFNGSSYDADSAPLCLGFASFWFGIAALTRLARLRIEQRDAWRQSLHRARRPELAPARRIGRPRYVDKAAKLPRASEVLRERRSRLRWVERALVTWMVIGLPVSGGLFGPAGIFAFPGVALVILAVQDHFERGASRGLRPPPDAEKRRLARARMRRSRGLWSASPPRVLVRMRVAFLLVVVVGFFFAALLPYLRGDDPGERYRAFVPWVIGFLAGLVALTLAERAQVRRERAWLADRKALRGVTR